jgi:hypothetical protein
MTAAPADRRDIIAEALRKIDDLSARLEIAVELTPAGVEKDIS